MPMQIPNAGPYDPRNIVGNANAEGIGTLYAAQADQQQAALESIKQGMDQLKLDEANRDLPKTAAQRQLDMSSIGNQQAMYDNGTERNLLQTTKDTALGTQQATQTTNQKTMRDNRADVVIQARQEFQAAQAQGGALGATHAWNERVVKPMQEAGITGFEGGPTPQNIQMLGHAADAATETQKQRQAMQSVTAETQSRERINAASIYSAEKIKQMELAVQSHATDNQVGQAMARLLSPQGGSMGDKAVVDNWFAAKSASSFANQNKSQAVNVAQAKLTAAQYDVETAIKKGDEKGQRAAETEVKHWEGELKKASGDANPMSGSSGIPQQPGPRGSGAAAPAPAGPVLKPSKTLSEAEAKAKLGAKYNPAKTYGIDANGNLLQSK